MTEQNQIYRCNVCGNVVEVLHPAAGQLVCCGQPMQLLEQKTEEEGKEKHLPVIERMETGFRVKVGSTPHPMEESHYIEWIEVIADGQIYKKFLKPFDEPEAVFCIQAENIEAREYCNVHGLWKS